LTVKAVSWDLAVAVLGMFGGVRATRTGAGAAMTPLERRRVLRKKKACMMASLESGIKSE